MYQFLTTIPGLIISVGAIFGVIVIGGLYALGLFKKTKDGEDDRLIKILEGTVNALEARVNAQKIEYDNNSKELNDKIDLLTEKVDELERENETLVKVLQGRDTQTKDFYKKSFDAMEIAKQTHNAVLEMGNKQTELMKMLIEYLKPSTLKVAEVKIKS